MQQRGGKGVEEISDHKGLNLLSPDPTDSHKLVIGDGGEDDRSNYDYRKRSGVTEV